MGNARTKFKSVNRASPFPVCEGVDGCSIGEDGLILCGRREGPQTGFVWLGKAKGDSQWNQYRRDGDPLLEENTATYNGQHKPDINWQVKAEEFARNLTSARAEQLYNNLFPSFPAVTQVPCVVYF